ncbi:MAG TPA: hypothetical protein VGJ37_02035 [Pyrinomonadaceae bacterium]|jgi:hypothetical protein
MLSFKNVRFLYEPYPIGLASTVFEEKFYSQLVESFPPAELFTFMPLHGNKYSLSEINNPDKYHEYVRTNAPWREFHQWLKRPEFPGEVLEMLRQHKIDLHVPSHANGSSAGGSRLKRLLRGDSGSPAPVLSARFEFSMLPAKGGFIKPHTDSPQKIITLVIAMLNKGEWNAEFGGGTEVLRPRDITNNYNFKNNYLEFDEVETLTTFDYLPNHCVIFIKTFNSLHAVSPMKAQDGGLMRKTLTVNIEKVL